MPGANGTQVGLSLALAFASICAPAGALAQQTPDTFTLPEPKPSPTPSPAVQGPVDIRSGVPIAPRLIDPQRNRPAQPAATPSRTPASRPSGEPSSSLNGGPPPPDAGSQSINQSDGSSAPAPPSSLNEAVDQAFSDFFSSQAAPEQTSKPAARPADQVRSSTTVLRAQEVERQGSETATGLETTIGSAETPQTGRAQPPQPQPQPQPPPTPGAAPWAKNLVSKAFGSPLVWSALVVVLLFFGTVFWWLGRSARQQRGEDSASLGDASPKAARKEGAAADGLGEDSAVPHGTEGLQFEIMKAIVADPTSELPPRDPTTPTTATTPPAIATRTDVQPPRIALSLDIVSAQRSVMMFTIDYRLTLANRGDAALRDLAVWATLSCAKSELNTPFDNTARTLLERVERIGPHQSRTLTGSLAMKMADISLIRQGAVPVFIPIMHVSVGSAGFGPSAARFVIGVPSEQNQTRLHPIAFDPGLGGIAGLRADRIRQAEIPAA